MLKQRTKRLRDRTVITAAILSLMGGDIYAAEPVGGARFIAGPEGSGTDAGGTGGGRSLNNWAAAGAVIAEISAAASASGVSRRPPRPDRLIPGPPEVMGMLFTENAANSSLQRRRMTPPGTYGKACMLVPKPRSSHNPFLARPRTRHKPCL